MDMFSSSPLMESFPSSRFPSPAPSPTRTETDLPLDVDQSFNSSMSISCSGDVSPTPSDHFLSPSAAFRKSIPIPSPELLSPTPMLGKARSRRPDPVPIQAGSRDAEVGMMQPFNSKRTFGREISTNTQRALGAAATKGLKGAMGPPAMPDGESPAREQNGGIPMKWSSSTEEIGLPRLTFKPALARCETEHTAISPSSTAGSEMDVDSPQVISRRPSGVSASPAFSGASSFSGSPGLGSFFCESPGAPSALPPAKRRSLLNGSPSSPSSPSAKRASYGKREMDKAASSSAMLFGTTVGRPTNLASRRTGPYKRPTLTPVIPYAASNEASTSQRSSSAASAYPILVGTSKPSLVAKFPGTVMRRAYSVCDQPQLGMTTPGQTEEDESEFEDSPSTTIHAEYARRHGQKFVPRVDGSPGFKPMRSSYAAPTSASPSSQCKKPSPYGAGGLPGFGDNEMDGKILPCHKVKEDGLVRITSETLDGLIEGKYKDKVKRYHILDCRFDYEFEGGHIAGAVNVKSMDCLDELLLSASQGVHSNGDALPVPSRSGELGDGEQVVLVFHCEFSAKRAPTFAKHLRSRDRGLNGNVYPKIFYPEVYILEGGYCGFYSSHSSRCDPQGYVPMDDPRHFQRRNVDLHDFRKFARTKSFTYGETQQQLQPTHSQIGSRLAPPCPPLAFAAASAAVGRRQGPTITEEEHDHEMDSSPAPGLGSPGYQASPCARISLGAPPVFGSAKPRQMTRVGFGRVQSFAGMTARR